MNKDQFPRVLANFCILTTAEQQCLMQTFLFGFPAFFRYLKIADNFTKPMFPSDPLRRILFMYHAAGKQIPVGFGNKKLDLLFSFCLHIFAGSQIVNVSSQ